MEMEGERERGREEEKKRGILPARREIERETAESVKRLEITEGSLWLEAK